MSLIITPISFGYYSFINYQKYIDCKDLEYKISKLKSEKPIFDCLESFNLLYNYDLDLQTAKKQIESFNSVNQNKKQDVAEFINTINEQFENPTINELELNYIDLLVQKQSFEEKYSEDFESIKKDQNILKNIESLVSNSAEREWIGQVIEQKPVELLSKKEEITTKVQVVSKEILQKRNNKNSLNDDEFIALSKKLKNFSADEFLRVSDEQISDPDKVNNINMYGSLADKIIYQIAFDRGYKYRLEAKPSDLTGKEELDLNIKVGPKLNELIEAGKKDGVKFKLVSGYRDPILQKTIFMSRLQPKCIEFAKSSCTTELIQSNKATQAINELLKTTSVPFTSKHHTGLTIDLSEDNVELTQFKNTKSYKWLSENNYFNAKRFGFVPSYPQGGTNMGPEPEPWEYVYVGLEVTTNK
ncbi:MAG: D-alanyl-D-alanine carboxypeptidase family protein [Patescibacteria group bacterium]